MSNVTSIKVLLDLRMYGKQPEWIDYVLHVIMDRLEGIKGISLYYLLENQSADENEDAKFDEAFIMTKDSYFNEINVFISPDPIVPDYIKKIVEITKYGILQKILSGRYGQDMGDEGKLSEIFQKNYDYYVVFSDHAKDIFLETTIGVNPDNVLVYSMNYMHDDLLCEKADEKLLDGDEKFCLAFYKKEYFNEMKMLVQGFIEYLEENVSDFIFVLACLDETDWSYKEICNLFQGHERNLLVMEADKPDVRSRLICEADAFFDVFWLDEVDIYLLKEMNYGRYIVSNSLYVKSDSILPVQNRVLDFKDSFLQLKNLFIEGKDKVSGAELPVSADKKKILQELFGVEQRKREKPLVTIVTITYNLIKAGRRDAIRQCLGSVHDQTYPAIEHIIIDGASDDGTLELFEEYKAKGWIHVFSEKDRGLYDAMNKGIRRARGRYIAFLNSDDFYHDNYGVEKTVCALQKSQAAYAFSDTNILNEDGSVYYWAADMGHMLYARNYCHQSMFTRLDVIRALNGFDLAYRVSADSDLMIRLFAGGYSYVHVPYPFVTYRGGGLSATTAEESRRDHAYSFFRHLGERYSLTYKDCYNLWQYRFLDEQANGIQIRLLSRIPSCFNSEMIFNEYLRRNQQQPDSLKKRAKRFIARRFSFNTFLLSRHMRVRDGRNEMVYYFCRIIPIWITKERI